MSQEIPQEVTRAKQRFGIVGNSPALVGAVERAIRVAPFDLTVLVIGESGSGKEFFPKILHQFGTRKHKKYIAVNCGAIPEGTIDSELFGHEKGSFTGAISARKGYFEEADGGTIFLDEVAELPMTTQARLLRVLETGEFLKVGSSEVQKTNVRIVAATNVDLVKAVESGKFRQDLYYRLATIQISVPNLHDRGEDIPLLARKFASDFAEKYRTEPITFSEDAKRLMMLYRWPGNVRQLKNVVDQLALFEAGSEISRRKLMESLPSGQNEFTSLAKVDKTPGYDQEREAIWQMLVTLRRELDELRAERDHLSEPVPAHDELSPMRSLIHYPDDEPAFTPYETIDSDQPLSLEDSEREAIIAALKRNNGSKRLTAKELNISERTLYRKIKEFNIQA